MKGQRLIGRRSGRASLDASLSPLRVWALMLHPDDGRAQSSLIESIAAEAVTQTLEDPGSGVEGVAATTAAWLRRSASIDSALDEATKRQGFPLPGWIAGQALLIPLMLQDFGIGTVGVGAARRLLESRHGASGLSERRFKEAWKRFAVVSHLWAADFILRDIVARQEGALPWSSCQPGELVHLLGMADFLRRRGESHTPAGASAPLLSPGVAIAIDGPLPDVVLTLGQMLERPTDAELASVIAKSANRRKVRPIRH